LNEASPAFIVMSRILIAMITLLLAIIPWSERYSMLDSFPNGQDTELNLLAFLVVLGLILLIARSGRKQLRSSFALTHLLLGILRPALSCFPERGYRLPLSDGDHPPHPGIYNLPLQI